MVGVVVVGGVDREEGVEREEERREKEDGVGVGE